MHMIWAEASQRLPFGLIGRLPETLPMCAHILYPKSHRKKPIGMQCVVELVGANGNSSVRTRNVESIELHLGNMDYDSILETSLPMARSSANGEDTLALLCYTKSQDLLAIHTTRQVKAGIGSTLATFL